MAEFVTSHAALGADFFVPVAPAKMPQTIIRYRNQSAAKRIGLDHLTSEDWQRHFGHFVPFEGSFEKPLALAYHGHQFGHYNPDIGDGRGFLFAQLKEAGTERLLDLGTKGSGQTPFSRAGDGCLTLKGAVREILATELLTSLGVSTSQTLSVIETGLSIQRHDEPSPTRSAVLVRLSHSHIRIGSFQRLFYLKNPKAKDTLLRYVVSHYYPQRDPEAPLQELAVTFLADLAERIAKMTGQWMAAGFVHGVLNTDNFNITGESFDYGPWRFLPHLDPNFTAAYFDHQGRYAYGRQPDSALWALCRLADCFVEEVGKEPLEEALHPFFAVMDKQMVKSLMRRLGIVHDNEVAITNALLQAARQTKCPFDSMFLDLYGGARPDKQIYLNDAFKPYFDSLEAPGLKRCLERQPSCLAKAEAASLVIDEVENLWAPIAEQDDWSLLTKKIDAIRTYGEMLACYDDTQALISPD